MKIHNLTEEKLAIKTDPGALEQSTVAAGGLEELSVPIGALELLEEAAGPLLVAFPDLFRLGGGNDPGSLDAPPINLGGGNDPGSLDAPPINLGGGGDGDSGAPDQVLVSNRTDQPVTIEVVRSLPERSAFEIFGAVEAVEVVGPKGGRRLRLIAPAGA
jgi:hypothetical protein